MVQILAFKINLTKNDKKNICTLKKNLKKKKKRLFKKKIVKNLFEKAMKII